MNLDFRKWYLNEVGTGSNCVAAFARPIGSEPVTRTWPSLFGDDDERKDDEDISRKKKKII